MSEAMQRQTGPTPAWLLFLGVAFGVVGASVNKHAENVGELVVALRGRTENSDAPVALALGQWGLLLLVVAAVVVLAGLVVIALDNAAQWILDAAQLPVAARRRLPFGLLHHHWCRPARTPEIQAMPAPRITELVIDQIVGS
jgi:hypothetical protein